MHQWHRRMMVWLEDDLRTVKNSNCRRKNYIKGGFNLGTIISFRHFDKPTTSHQHEVPYSFGTRRCRVRFPTGTCSDCTIGEQY